MILKIKVKPNSSDFKIEDLGDNNYFVKLKSPAEDNKANRELVKNLSKYLRISFDKIKIKFGLKGKNKLVEVS